MCGIFGAISTSPVQANDLDTLVLHAQQRGRDSSGLLTFENGVYSIQRADYPIDRLLKEVRPLHHQLVLGHSRLITNGLGDNQPVVGSNVAVLHNGIVVNHESIWTELRKAACLEIDTEVIAAIAESHIEEGGEFENLPSHILELCRGVVACALILPRLGKLCLFSNNGSLFIGSKASTKFFASERYPLTLIGCDKIQQVRDAVFVDIPISDIAFKIADHKERITNLIPALSLSGAAEEEKRLDYRKYEGHRCTKCLLTKTMPFISFDADGICNYCRHYKPRNEPRPKEDLFRLVEPYRRTHGDDCLVPFSGGRDSCYGLHLIVKELKMKPITYTYDWGMVTDLGRRNISRMSAELGVENIIVADDITKKREYIAKNLRAWLTSPHLGMISILTAGDKHFFRHIETIKRQTGISLNLWGINPLEVTHFKAGFLGVPPDFEEKRVYSHGAMKQLRYQFLRLRAMLQSPGYFNSSLWDTLSGEYYRSFTKKTDYHHIFDYWRWDEKQIDDTLAGYDWEKAPDTKTTWRIGDGTAAFYNYVYYTVAGFTEHDTFRSNQIREGDLTRAEALEMVQEENMPRYPNIKWYLDALGMDFKEVIRVVNEIPKLY
ncbi:glucosamine 6-phosphate synthetase [Acidovorax sp.]|uniref:glucosamine 6-phosphate synthetase n=1 Tax=Acidovorax sp. TaxID=1872122 RepID=UPI00403783A0